MSIQSFPGGTVLGAITDDSTRERLYQHILDQLARLTARSLNNANPSGGPLPAPPPAQFTVTGQDGDTHIDITNPQEIAPGTVNQFTQLNLEQFNASLRPIQHRIQSSTDESFSDPSLITEQPLTYDTHIVVKQPNTTKFWRLQSRYDGGDYNDWQWWNDPASCGPVAVWSGILSSPSTDFLNSSATTSDGSNALSQDGTTTNILVAGKTWNVGPQRIVYNSGHVDPGLYGSYLVYAVDIKKAGGAATYIATLAIADLTAQDGIVYFGNIKTLAGGGGTVIGGGDGPGCVATGTKILSYTADGAWMEVERLKKGDRIQGIDGGPETLQADPIPAFFPCFRFTTRDFELVCSHLHLLLRTGGRPEQAAELHEPYQVMGKTGPIDIWKREYVGKRLVWELKLDRTRTYCANGFWSHNKIFIPQT